MLQTTLAVLSVMSCLPIQAQDSCQPVQAEIVKSLSRSDKVRSNDTFYYAQKIFTVSFIGAINDSIKVYIADILIYEGHLQAGDLRQNIQVPFKSRYDRPKMRIYFVNRKACITELLNLNFPILELKVAERWYLTYTNNFASLE